MIGIDMNEAMKEKYHNRSEEERQIDNDYDAMVERIAGIEAVEVPMRDQLDTTGQGLVLVAVDPSDLGYQVAATEQLETPNMGTLAAIAVKFAFEAIPKE